MSNFTYENTKDATHLISGEFKKIVKGNYPEYLSPSIGYIWVKSGFSIEYLLSCKFITELSRPQNETRDYWTANGVTQYAQGNKMNTKEMLPISYVKKFTPLVVGDMWATADGDKGFVMEANVEWFNDGADGNLFYITSFADRPYKGCDGMACGMNIDVSWLGPNETWKPNHPSMLKQCQAEQGKGATWDVKESYVPHGGVPSKAQANAFINKGDSESNMIADLDNLNCPSCGGSGHVDDADNHDTVETPTFTQPMADAGELPPIGADFLWCPDSQTGWIEAKILAWDGDFAWMFFHGKRESVGNPTNFNPVKTDEDKARDQLRDIISDYLGRMINDDSSSKDIALTLLASLEFTITLNDKE